MFIYIYSNRAIKTAFLSSAVAIKKLRRDVDMGTAEDSIKDWLKSRKFVKNNANVSNIE